MNNKWIFVGIGVFALFLGGMFFLAQKEQSTATATEKVFLPYAQKLGLDTEQFITAMKGDAVNNRIASDRTMGDEKNISGTPTFYINGVREEFRSPEDLEKLIASYREKNEPQEIPEGANVTGAQQPKVLIVEYSDFQCPACGAYAPIVKTALENNAQDTALIYRNFPLTSLHPMALPAARAAEAAGLQGKFWEMHDLLFANQKEWS